MIKTENFVTQRFWKRAQKSIITKAKTHCKESTVEKVFCSQVTLCKQKKESLIPMTLRISKRTLKIFLGMSPYQPKNRLHIQGPKKKTESIFQCQLFEKKLFKKNNELLAFKCLPNVLKMYYKYLKGKDGWQGYIFSLMKIICVFK